MNIFKIDKNNRKEIERAMTTILRNANDDEDYGLWYKDVCISCNTVEIEYVDGIEIHCTHDSEDTSIHLASIYFNSTDEVFFAFDVKPDDHKYINIDTETRSLEWLNELFAVQ